MKLAHMIKPRSLVEITLDDGTVIALNVPHSIYKLEVLDDESQQLEFSTQVTSGRRKGEHAKLIVPYASIRQVLVTG